MRPLNLLKGGWVELPGMSEEGFIFCCYLQHLVSVGVIFAVIYMTW